MGDLEGQVAFVTGGSRGIGRGVALELAKRGADVAINYRRDGEAAEQSANAVRSLGRRASIHRADVADFDAVQSAVDDCVEQLGRIDIVVANSGVASKPAPVATLDVAEWRRVTSVDLDGVFYTCRAALPRLVEQGSGSLVLISSIGADLCAPFGAPYYAAKAGVNALVKVLAKELAPQQIRVNGVAPGLIASDMGQRMIDALGEAQMLADIPLKRPGTPEEVGKLVAYLASPDAAFITGQIYRIDGGAVM